MRGIPAAAVITPASLRIRRLPLQGCSPVPSPPAGLFLWRQRKRRKKPPEGTYFEAVPSGLLPRRPRGRRPHWIPHVWTRDEGLDGSCGLPQPLAGLRNDERRGTRNTLGPVGQVDRQAPNLNHPRRGLRNVARRAIFHAALAAFHPAQRDFTPAKRAFHQVDTLYQPNFQSSPCSRPQSSKSLL